MSNTPGGLNAAPNATSTTSGATNDDVARAASSPDAAQKLEWREIKSKRGFTIRFPGAPQLSAEETDNYKQTHFFWREVEGTNQTTFLVSCTIYDAGFISRHTQEALQKHTIMQKVHNHFGHLTERKSVTISGAKGTEYAFRGFPHGVKPVAGMKPDMHSRGRLFWAGNAEYLVQTTTTKPKFPRECQTFLDSFSMTPQRP